MRKIIIFALLFTSMLTYAATKVEVYYFHYSRRCATCNAVEEVTKKTISESFASQFKKREITFKSVNLDEDTSETLAKKCKAEGQALLIISNGKRIDLTDKAFMYARTSPEKLKGEVKKAISMCQ
ncbi:MAG: nitrophenyl compound nitroreductase subunit ArsF family protein [Paludibacter sp.]